MPIIVNLYIVLAYRKMRLNTLVELVDITQQNLCALRIGKFKAIRFDTFEKIYEALECQLGDILAFTKDEVVSQ